MIIFWEFTMDHPFRFEVAGSTPDLNPYPSIGLKFSSDHGACFTLFIIIKLASLFSRSLIPPYSRNRRKATAQSKPQKYVDCMHSGQLNVSGSFNYESSRGQDEEVKIAIMQTSRTMRVQENATLRAYIEIILKNSIG